jgi:tRNA (guanine26-N2/guanine27-N2)-dimethyltransferase
MRKYSAVPLNNEFHSEMGLRILIGSIARETAKYDKGIKILLSHATRHYVRVYTEILHGAKNADKTINEIGFAAWCPKCGSVETKKGLAVFMNESCPFCQKNAKLSERKMSGPLWLGSLKEIDFCDKVIQELDNLSLNKKDDAKKMLTLCRNEAEIPFFYDQHLLCETLKISAPAIEPFLENLRNAGYTATRTHFSGTSFKSDAPLDIILKILKKN